MGLMKCRVAEALDPAALRTLAAEGCTIGRAAEFLGVHWTTLERAARVHQIVFVKAFGPRYGWQGILPRVKNQIDNTSTQ